VLLAQVAARAEWVRAVRGASGRDRPDEVGGDLAVIGDGGLRDELSFHEHQRIFHELRRHLAEETEPSVRQEICALLCRLRDRDDAFRATFDDISWVLKAEDERR
jgi:hypothetical protein